MMFSLQHSENDHDHDQLVYDFQTLNYDVTEDLYHLNEILPPVTEQASDGFTDKMKSKGGRKKNGKQSSSSGSQPADNNGELRKKLHREIERQRRQEMTQLYSSLRLLLPLEYIKGKRSISDHMNGAVNYIKKLQENISELETKRDKLKKLCSSSSTTASVSAVADAGAGGDSQPPVNNQCSTEENGGGPKSIITVKPCKDGAQVLISVGKTAKRGLLPSRVMTVLAEKGLSVVSYVSATVNDCVLHSIRTEASDQTCVQLSSLLQEKLKDMVD